VTAVGVSASLVEILRPGATDRPVGDGSTRCNGTITLRMRLITITWGRMWARWRVVKISVSEQPGRHL